MGQAYLMRRGSAKSLKVVSCASADAFPTVVLKNTMAVISDVPSVRIYIQAERPENGEAGDVWARTGDGDAISMYTSRSSLEIGVMHVEQHDGEKWKRVEAHVYDGAQWRQVSVERYMLYKRGEDNTAVTGGWATDAHDGISLTFGTDSIVFKVVKDGNRYASFYTKNKIDLTEYKTLGIVLSKASGVGTSGDMYLGATLKAYTGASGPELGDSYTAGGSLNVAPDKGKDFTEERDFIIDISALDTSYYIQIGASIASATIHEIYLL